MCLLDSGDVGDREEAIEAMQKVQGLRQKIAGKSIPLEVRVFSRVK